MTAKELCLYALDQATAVVVQVVAGLVGEQQVAALAVGLAHGWLLLTTGQR